jgi:transcriptional regulator of arginine metabolism
MQKSDNIAYNCTFKLYNYTFMKNRSERIRLIKKIVSEGIISSQDELQLRLQEQGCEVTQATLSRDLKELRVIKVSDSEAGYIYRFSANGTADAKSKEETLHGNILADGVLSVEFSGNLGVVKTMPGYASGIALMIDRSNSKELLGTIAGDDTILLILREGVVQSEVIEALKTAIPNWAIKSEQ